MDQLPNLGIYGNLEPCDENIVAGLNYNSVLLDALLHASVIDFVAALPGSPSDGDRYVLTTNDTFNYYKDAAWVVITPEAGFWIYNQNDNSFYYFDGTDWINFNANITALLTANSTFDRNRANHTGTQLANTISDFNTAVLAIANNYVHPNHSGDVVSVGDGGQTIQPNVVDNTKAADMATQTIKGRATAGSGDPEDLTPAQATSILNTFTSLLKGLVPASGGGTTNFLRADGSWVPPGAGGDVFLVENASPSNPPNDTTLSLYSRVRTVAPDLSPEYKNNFGGQYRLETNGFRKRRYAVDAIPGGTTFVNTGGITALTVTGTATAGALSLTNFHQSMARVEAAVTTAAVGAVAGWRGGQNVFRRGGGSASAPYAGGFRFLMRFGIGRGIAANTNRRLFAGMTTSTAAPTNVDPSTILNIIGVGADTADTNWQFMTRGSGAVLKTNTGIAKAVGADNESSFELEIFARTSNSGAEDVIIKFTDITNGFTAGTPVVHIANSNLPLETDFLSPRVWGSTGATSSVIGITLMEMIADIEYYYG